MEAILFLGALIVLTVAIYGTLHRHHRNKHKDRVTDQIVRDRFDRQT
jgi:uncharacterized membrane protein